MLATYAEVFAASFVFIFLKAWQQLNVVHHQLLWIVPTSMSMALAEVFLVVSSAHNGWGLIVIPVGLGSGLGCLVSVILNKRMRGAK